MALRLSALALALALGGCTSMDSLVSGEKVDYRSQSAKTQPLDVPPDLSQLARDGRYTPQAGVVSANAMRQPGGAAPSAAAAPVPVAASSLGDMRIERNGKTRWLVSPMPPEQIYPLVRAFWLERGFVLSADSPELGVMETDWAENRAKLPSDLIRNTLGKLLDNLFSTGERDRFRTRIERSGTGSEVFITHRGLEEVLVGQQKETSKWQAKPSDPQLEAEFLSRLMLRLGAKDEPAVRTAVANAPDQPARARPATGAASGPAVMELDEGFDRAWRQVGLALDRSGFTVEDRDRAAGLYFVRYIDPRLAGQEEPGFFAKLFGQGGDAKRLQRYRVVLKTTSDKTRVSVQTSDGTAEEGEAAKRIIGRLVEELR